MNWCHREICTNHPLRHISQQPVTSRDIPNLYQMMLILLPLTRRDSQNDTSSWSATLNIWDARAQPGIYHKASLQKRSGFGTCERDESSVIIVTEDGQHCGNHGSHPTWFCTARDHATSRNGTQHTMRLKRAARRWARQGGLQD